jgi:hypothetical protein
MEHRYSPRVSTNLKVLMYKRGLPVAVGWLRNLGRHGVFVASEYTNVGINQPLEIEILMGAGEGGARERCKTTLVHKTELGFGLVFDETCMASSDLLASLLEKYRRRDRAFREPRKAMPVTGNISWPA